MKVLHYFLVSCLTASLPGAAATLNVQLDTSLLQGHPAFPFYLSFQLLDGSGLPVGNGNSRVTLSEFAFGSGSPGGAPTTAGGASGDLLTSVVLEDTAFFNEFVQEFLPGGILTFQVSFSVGGGGQSAPDLFGFSILDNLLMPIPTVGFADALLVVTLDGAHPNIELFGGDPTRGPAAAPGTPLPLAGPVATPLDGNEIPEPGAMHLTLAGLAALAFACGWGRR